MTARTLRNALGAQDLIRAVRADLLDSGNDLDAEIALHIGVVLRDLIDRLAHERTNAPEETYS